MIERLPFEQNAPYYASEAAVHINRYSLAKRFCAGKRVLDLACGEGYGSYLMAAKWGAKEVIGIDVAHEAIENASRWFGDPRITFLKSSAEAYPSAISGLFDVIICLETFEHVSNPKTMLENFKASLAPGGVIIVTCPNDNLYYQPEDSGNPFHVRRYTFGEFQQLSQEILGVGNFLVGTGFTGFINSPVESPLLEGESSYSKEVREGVKTEPLTTLIRADKPLTPDKASYFVGIWGITAQDDLYTLSGSPTEREPYFIQQKYDECLRQTWEIERLQARIAELESQLLQANAKVQAPSASETIVQQNLAARLAKKGLELIRR